MAITVLSGGISTNATTAAPTLPSTAAAGDLFICHAAQDGAGTFTWDSPAVEIKDQAFTGGVNTVGYLIASGGETAMPRVTSTVSERWEWNVWEFPAGEWHGTTAPEINTGVTGNNTSPNPGSITPSWGSETNNIWLALCARDDSVANTITAYPTNYSTAQSDKNNITSAANAGGAVRIVTGSPEDPGAFTISATETWIAYAVAIRPAAAGSTVIRTTADTVTYSDGVVRIGTFLRAVSDSLGLANTVARTGTFLRTTADTLGLAEVVARAGTFLRTTGDGLSFADTVAGLKITLRTLDDTLGLSDAVSRAGTFLRSNTDSLGLTDVVNRVTTALRSLADTTTYGDAVTRAVTATRSAADGVTHSDAVERVVSAVRTATDSIAYSDAVTRAVTAVRTAADSLSLASVVAAVGGGGVTIGTAVLSFFARAAAVIGFDVTRAASLNIFTRHGAALSMAGQYEYDLNDTWSPTVTFTVSGVATDPTTITLTVISPDKVSTAYTYAAAQITKDSTGVYHKDITLTQRGIWYCKFDGTGACQASAEGTITVIA